MDKYQGEDIEELNEPKWQLLSTSFFPNKPLEKLYSLKKIIIDSDPDIVMLVEVGGLQSLVNFNKHFLGDKYEVFFEESNSDRGIDVGYLAKKNIPETSFFLVSHNSAKLEGGRRFARGLLELRVLQKGKVKAVTFLSHLKSKLDIKKQDFEGRGQRGAEVKFIVTQAKKTQSKFPNVPAIICGDLNGVIYKEDTEEELIPFEKAGFKDVFEHLDLPLENRQTYYFFNKGGNRVPMQLDYVLVHEKFADKVGVETKVLPMDQDKVPHPPETLKQKKKLPSDHYPVFCRLNL